MKLTQKYNNKATKSGMTLLELTVVILVLLSLIAILFIGARAWKKGSDRAGCIMNIRNVQQAVRGHMNMNALNVVPASTLIYSAPAVAGNADPLAGPIVAPVAAVDGYLPGPSCPAQGVYTYTAGAAAPPGTIILSCSLATTEDHIPTGTSTW